MAVIALSEEEIIVALTYLQLPSILGLTPVATANVPQEQLGYGLQVAERAMVAHEVLRRQADMTLAVREEDAAILRAASESTWVLTVNRDADQKGSPESYHFYHGAEFTVAHDEPLGTIHRFTTLDDGIEQALQAAYSLMAPNEEKAAPCPPAIVPQNAFQAVYRNGLEGNVGWLVNQPAAPYLRETLQGERVAVHAVAFRPRESTPEAGNFTLLVGGGWAWLLQPHSPTELALVPAGQEDVIQVLSNIAP